MNLKAKISQNETRKNRADIKDLERSLTFMAFGLRKTNTYDSY